MLKFFISSSLLMIFAASALAKPIDVYPVSCADLWMAVKDTLGNQSNYAVVFEDEAGQKARFVVIGVLNHYSDKVTLVPVGGGCMANATIPEDGPGNGDWRQFHHRLAKSLAKLQAVKPKPAETAIGHP
jgi:hypothetical protein